METIWKTLGIAATKDKKQIKRAYLQILKSFEAEREHQRFFKLRSAYEAALGEVETSSVSTASQASPQIEFCSKVTELPAIEDNPYPSSVEVLDIENRESSVPDPVSSFGRTEVGDSFQKPIHELLSEELEKVSSLLFCGDESDAITTLASLEQNIFFLYPSVREPFENSVMDLLLNWNHFTFPSDFCEAFMERSFLLNQSRLSEDYQAIWIQLINRNLSARKFELFLYFMEDRKSTSESKNINFKELLFGKLLVSEFEKYVREFKVLDPIRNAVLDFESNYALAEVQELNHDTFQWWISQLHYTPWNWKYLQYSFWSLILFKFILYIAVLDEHLISNPIYLIFPIAGAPILKWLFDSCFNQIRFKRWEQIKRFTFTLRQRRFRISLVVLSLVIFLTSLFLNAELGNYLQGFSLLCLFTSNNKRQNCMIFGWSLIGWLLFQKHIDEICGMSETFFRNYMISVFAVGCVFLFKLMVEKICFKFKVLRKCFYDPIVAKGFLFYGYFVLYALILSRFSQAIELLMSL